MIYKPTVVSSSMIVPATSYSKKIVNGSSATTVGTTVITYSQSELPNNGHHSTNTNQGGVAVVGNNNGNGQSGQAAQSNKSGKGNGHGEGLPQTGEAAATAAVGLGIVLIAISGIVVLGKKK